MKQKYMFRSTPAWLPSYRHDTPGERVEMEKVDLLGCDPWGRVGVLMTSGWFSMTEDIRPEAEGQWQREMNPPNVFEAPTEMAAWVLSQRKKNALKRAV